MNIVHKTELKLENFDKCSFSCDNDCSLGMIYDYACAVQSFVIQKMKEAEAKPEEVKSEESKINIRPSSCSNIC